MKSVNGCGQIDCVGLLLRHSEMEQSGMERLGVSRRSVPDCSMAGSSCPDGGWLLPLAGAFLSHPFWPFKGPKVQCQPAPASKVTQKVVPSSVWGSPGVALDHFPDVPVQDRPCCCS